MPDVNGYYTIRECANEILRAMEKHGDSQEKLSASLIQAANKLMDRPDFTSLGVKYKPNHVPEGTYLFYDGELSMTYTRVPAGRNVPPHDHGIWEAVIVHSGKLRHKVYERTDDQTREGYAELAITEDRILGPRDISLVMPPSEIHSFIPVDGDCWTLTIVGGNYKPNRYYYQPENNSYVTTTTAGKLVEKV